MNKKQILVAIDGSAITEALLDYAIWLAQSNGMKILLLHTIEHDHKSEHPQHEGNLTPNIRRELLKQLSDEERQQSKLLMAAGKRMLQKSEQRVLVAGLKDVETKLRHGTLPEAITDLHNETALVMLGSKGLNHQRGEKGLGLHLEEAIRATQTPVFIAQKPFVQPKKVLFAYNGSPTSKRALDMIAKDTIYQEPLEVHVVCVNSDEVLAQNLINEAQQVLSQSSANVMTKTMSGDVLEQLVSYQKQQNIDLTAMGAFSHGKLHGFFFGSFTTKMIQNSDANFLLIR